MYFQYILVCFSKILITVSNGTVFALIDQTDQPGIVEDNSRNREWRLNERDAIGGNDFHWTAEINCDRNVPTPGKMWIHLHY